MMNTYENIVSYLQENEISYKSVHHEETHTSEESAKARGEDISVGGKAILMKVADEFVLLVISASQRIDTKKIKKFFNAKSTRFASIDELKDLTGLVPGSVPPFGSPILSFKLYIDKSIAANNKIAFNAGSLTDSIIMSVSDYVKVANPIVFDFSKD